MSLAAASSDHAPMMASPEPIAVPEWMPPHRAMAFARAIAKRYQAEANPSDTGSFFAQMAFEQKAIADALANPEFQEAATRAYQHELAVQQPNKAYAPPAAQARAELVAVLENRMLDTVGFIALLHDPAFQARVLKIAGEPNVAAKTPYTLPAGKQEEIIRRLVQPLDADGPEPLIHVGASALGQRIVHQALANLFRPSGVLRAPLVHALATVAPTLPGGVAEYIAEHWLKARHDPAHSIADGLAPEGELLRESLGRASALHEAKIDRALAEYVAPQNEVNAPSITPLQRLQEASPEQTMDRS